MTRLQTVRWFASEVAGEHVVVSRTTDEWSCSVTRKHPMITIPRDVFTNDEDDKIFRRDFVARCPLARGFSNPTISVLHELGHFFTLHNFPNENWEDDDNMTTEEHIKVPCEVAATNWAIEWLQNADNRKVAKAFERELFKAVR